MRDPASIKNLLDRLRVAWESAPSLRLAQIVSLAAPRGEDTFYIEDDDFVRAIETALASDEDTRKP